MKQSVTTFDEFVKNAFTSSNFFDYKKGPEPFFSPECQKAIMDHYVKETQALHGAVVPLPVPPPDRGAYRAAIGDKVIEGTYPLAVAKPSAPQGAVCTKCNGRNEYAEPSSSYVCYECR